VNTNEAKAWSCAQIGAREHYAVPRALHRAGQLAALYTDFWAGSGTRKVLQITGRLRSLASRYHPDLADARVHSHNLRALAWEAKLRRRSRDGGEIYLRFCDVGRRFTSAVLEDLRGRGWSPGMIFYAYDTGALEIFTFLKELGVRCILNQMDPSRVEANLVREEEKSWPGWSIGTIDVPEEYFGRREREWALADHIVVNSDFSRQGLLEQGVPPAKVGVIPLCYEIKGAGCGTERSEREMGVAPSFSRHRPLRVLFLGQVILRKGIQYLIEAANLLRDEPVQFAVVGPVGISSDAVASAPGNVCFHGRVDRDQAAAWYCAADVFVLPTLSDGFAITQIEAMAYGLPVIATSHCGAVVTDGVDGFIVPVRNGEVLAQTVTRYISEPGLLPAQRIAALRKAKQFTLDQLTKSLLQLGKSVSRR